MIGQTATIHHKADCALSPKMLPVSSPLSCSSKECSHWLMAGEIRLIPPENTVEHFDFLIEALVEEVLIYAHFDTSEDAVNFHIGMLRAAYQRAMERSCPECAGN